MIFDSHLQPVYRYSVPATTADAAEAGRSASLSSLARAALAAPPYPPVPATAFARVRHTIYFAAAQRIEPFEAPAGHLLNKRYALVYLLPVDAAMLRALQSGFHVAPLAVLPKPEPGAAHVPLASADGMPLAWLSWISARPGADFANAAAPLAVACFIVLAALQILVLRSWMEVAKRMQAESVARSAFLANTSHELRTPLNAIIGFSDCMVGEMFGPLSPRYREYARDIKTSGQLLLGIVNDVLDLTQLNNTSDFPMKPLNPGEALIGAVRMLREYAKADHISVDYVDASGGAQVAGSEKALSQILLNLGSNAVKFSPPQSSIDVVLRRGPDCVELVVRDYGMGIPADKLSHIGQPFFQAHAGNARKPGSGLGLAIVKKLTERLGGEFAIASTLGAGTTVTVRLPQLKLPSEPTRARAA
jgi:signal transduction histidine kinase